MLLDESFNFYRLRGGRKIARLKKCFAAHFVNFFGFKKELLLKGAASTP